MPMPVIDAVVEHLRLEAEIGGYEAALAERDRLESVYASLAELLNCDASEVALFENATRAFNAVLYSIPFRRGDRILTGKSEYCSNYMAYLHLSQTVGTETVVIPDDEDGQIDVSALRQGIDERVKLIVLTHVPTSGGLVNPAADVGQVAAAAGVPYLLDACQSVGQLPIDVREIGCDFLAAAGRKFLRGPRGTGFLFVRREWFGLHPAMMDLGGATWTRRDGYALRPDARRFETWEASHALRLGLGRAVDYALDLGMASIWARVSDLSELLRARLESIPGVIQHDLGATRCGIVTFSVGELPADDIRAALAAKDVTIDLSYLEDTRLDLEGRAPERFLRASVHYYNTDQEIGRLSELVGSFARGEDMVAG